MNKRGRVASIVLVALVVALGLGGFTSLASPTSGAAHDVTLKGETAVPVSLPAGASAEWWAAVQENLGTSEAVDTVEPATPDWSYPSSQANALHGRSVNTAGDVNGDGYDDVIVGALRFNSTTTAAGQAYIFYGSAEGLNTTPDRTLNPPTTDAYGFFGVPVGTAGDVNCDGYDDVIVGMQNYDNYSPSYTHDEGAVFVYYGSETGIGTSHDWMAESNQTWAHFGLSAGTAGDVNGDGCDDIIVGAYCPVTYHYSKAFIWYGDEMPTGLGPNGTPDNADWSANDPSSWTGFGSTVGTAGDVNGDSYADVYVGAAEYDNPEENEGAVWVWYGSASGPTPNGTPSNADWMAETNQENAYLNRASWWGYGSSGTAGDVNGDGFDDFVAGALYYDNGENNEGAVFLWYGAAMPTGLGPDGTPDNADWIAEGDQAGAILGADARSAGDFNDDGYSDVIVGAYGYDVDSPTAIANAGAAMIWYGSADGMGANGTPANADWMAVGTQENDDFGISVATAGNANGAAGAVVVGATYFSDPANEYNHGAAYLFNYAGTRVYLPLMLRNY